MDEEKLKHLDVLEDYPKLYTRRLEGIEVLASDDPDYKVGQQVEAITYFLIKHKEEMLRFDMMDEYSSSGDHGKPYV